MARCLTEDNMKTWYITKYLNRGILHTSLSNEVVSRSFNGWIYCDFPFGVPWENFYKINVDIFDDHEDAQIDFQKRLECVS